MEHRGIGVFLSAGTKLQRSFTGVAGTGGFRPGKHDVSCLFHPLKLSCKKLGVSSVPAPLASRDFTHTSTHDERDTVRPSANSTLFVSIRLARPIAFPSASLAVCDCHAASLVRPESFMRGTTHSVVCSLCLSAQKDPPPSHPLSACSHAFHRPHTLIL